MTTVSLNNKNSTRLLRESMLDAADSLRKLATGQKFSNPGEGVVEQNIARSIDFQRSVADVTLNAINDAGGMLDSVYNTVSNIRNNVLGQYEIALNASSSSFSDFNELQKEFNSLKDQIDYNANFSFNGVTLLDGSFDTKSSSSSSSSAAIETKVGENTSYLLKSVADFFVSGSVQDGSILDSTKGVTIASLVPEKQASAQLAFSALISNNDTVVINGVTFTAINSATGLSNDPNVRATQFSIGNSGQVNTLGIIDNTEALNNLLIQLQSSNDERLNLATYRFSNNINGVSQGIEIIYNKPGIDGNSFTYSVTGANAQTGTLSNGNNLGNANSPILFEGLSGKFQDFDIKFRNDDANNHNLIKFQATINGNLYETAEIILSSNKSAGKIVNDGNILVGGTVLGFHRVDGDNAEVGFTLTTANDLVLRNVSDSASIERQINEVLSGIRSSLSNITFNISAKSVVNPDFGISSGKQYSLGGDASNVIGGSMNVLDTVGTTHASGIIRLLSNPKKGDIININGTNVIFGKDVQIATNSANAATNIANTQTNLLRFLTNSNDANISQAVYNIYRDSSETSISVTSKISGSEGRSFTISSDSDDFMFNNFAPDVKSVHLGDNAAEIGGTKAVLTRARTTLNITVNPNPTAGIVIVFGTPSASGTSVTSTAAAAGLPIKGSATLVSFRSGTTGAAALNSISSAATPADNANQVPIGATIADTVNYLFSFLKSSTDSNISQYTYELNNAVPSAATGIIITAKDYGTKINISPASSATNLITPITGNPITVTANAALDLNGAAVASGSLNAAADNVAADGNAASAYLLLNTVTGTTATTLTQPSTTTFNPGGIMSGDTIVIGGVTFTFTIDGLTSGTTVGIGSNAVQTAYNLASALRANSNTTLTNYNYEVVLTSDTPSRSPGIKITAKNKGAAGNSLTVSGLDLGFSTMAPVVNNNTRVIAPKYILLDGNAKDTLAATVTGTGATATRAYTISGGYDPMTISISRGTNSNVRGNYSPNLKGKITGISADFVEGSVSTSTPNSVRLEATVGSVNYVASVMLSGGISDGTTATGSNYNNLGHLITKGTKIAFASSDSTHTFVLTVNKDINLSGKSKDEVNVLISNLENDVAASTENLVIMQERIVANFDPSKDALGAFAGMKSGDITIIDSEFDDKGNASTVRGFTVDSAHDTISVKIGNTTYSQKLSNTLKLGGLGQGYNAAAKTIKVAEKPVLLLKANDGSGKALKINLSNVSSNIVFASDAQAKDIQSTLNGFFGLGSGGTTAGGGMQIRTGTGANSIISVGFRDMRSGNIYRDSGGNIVNIDLTTAQSAEAAVNVLQQTLKDLSSDLSSIAMSRAKFDTAADNIDLMMKTLSDTYSRHMDADVIEVSDDMVKGVLKVSSATLAQLHQMGMLKDLITSLGNI